MEKKIELNKDISLNIGYREEDGSFNIYYLGLDDRHSGLSGSLPLEEDMEGTSWYRDILKILKGNTDKDLYHDLRLSLGGILLHDKLKHKGPSIYSYYLDKSNVVHSIRMVHSTYDAFDGGYRIELDGKEISTTTIPFYLSKVYDDMRKFLSYKEFWTFEDYTVMVRLVARDMVDVMISKKLSKRNHAIFSTCILKDEENDKFYTLVGMLSGEIVSDRDMHWIMEEILWVHQGIADEYLSHHYRVSIDLMDETNNFSLDDI